MYLVINLGLKSIRGIVFSNSGDQLYSKSLPVHTTLLDEKVEQDATEYLALLKKILLDISHNTNLAPKISYITATTSSSCIFGVDEKFCPVTKVMMVSDRRSQPIVEKIKTLNSYTIIGELGSFCSYSSLLPKVLWHKENSPMLFEKTKYWMGVGEFLNYYFTGEFFTDQLNASKAFFTNGAYQKDLFNELGFETDKLAKVVTIGEKFNVRKDLIENYNLDINCKYILTTYDAICALIGSSNGEKDNASDVSGTVTSIRVLLQNSLLIRNSLLHIQEIPLINKYALGASNNLGGGIIEWYRQAFFPTCDDNVYSNMENQASLVEPGSGGVIFLPFLLGERAPISMPNATATFFGLNRRSTQKEITRAVFESCAFITRSLVELIESQSIQINSLSVSGGLARIDLINQIKADVTNKTIIVMDNFESTSVGAFLLMSISTNLYDSFEEALKNIVKIRKIIHPSSRNNKYYTESFKLFEELNLKLLSLYNRQSSLVEFKKYEEKEIVKNL